MPRESSGVPPVEVRRRAAPWEMPREATFVRQVVVRAGAAPTFEAPSFEVPPGGGPARSRCLITTIDLVMIAICAISALYLIGSLTEEARERPYSETSGGFSKGWPRSGPTTVGDPLRL